MNATIEVFAASIQRAQCKGCKAAIVWATVVSSGRHMCFNSIKILETKLERVAPFRVIKVVDRTLNHWATCPQADQFRRREDRSLPGTPRMAAVRRRK
jgi:hypothetical protein